MDSLTPPSEFMLEKLELNPNAIKDIKPRLRRSQLRAVVNWLSKEYKLSPEASNLEKVNPFLQAFYHLCEIQEWDKAWQVLQLRLNTPANENLIIQLNTWGYYYEESKIIHLLLDRIPALNTSLLILLGTDVYSQLGNTDKAMEYLEKGLLAAKAENDLYQEGLALGGIGKIYIALGKFQKTIDYLQRSLAIKQKTKHTSSNETSLICSSSEASTLQGNRIYFSINCT